MTDLMDWDVCDKHTQTFPKHDYCPYCRIEELERRLKAQISEKERYAEIVCELQAALDEIAALDRFDVLSSNGMGKVELHGCSGGTYVRHDQIETILKKNGLEKKDD